MHIFLSLVEITHKESIIDQKSLEKDLYLSQNNVSSAIISAAMAQPFQLCWL